MRELLRENRRFFWWGTLAALTLRLVFILWFPAVVDDSRLYSDIAKNWLQHGIYGVTDSGQVVPTLSRLPGYPAFLAIIFAIFGLDHFRAVLMVQMFVDLGTCLVVADMARRMLSPRAAKAAFLLTALCPFLANYAAAALTETLEVFFTALALDLAICGLDRMEERALPWLGCGLSVGACILLRPDGGILLAAIGGYLLILLVRRLTTGRAVLPVMRAGVILGLTALAPLVPWTLRNLRTLHRFEPLAPRYANDTDEMVMAGFNRWVKTWMVDYVSVQEIYWPVPGDAIDASKLPDRAFDSEPQRSETQEILDAYNEDHEITPELDARFVGLAAARIHAAPLRYYVWLPALRIADMWLRPRTELTAADPRWWEFNDDVRGSIAAVGFGLVNLFYVLTAAGGVLTRQFKWLGLVLLFVMLRSLFLGTLENPEPRYTLECYAAVIGLAGALWARTGGR